MRQRFLHLEYIVSMSLDHYPHYEYQRWNMIYPQIKGITLKPIDHEKDSRNLIRQCIPENTINSKFRVWVEYGYILGHVLLVDLEDVDGHATGGGELLLANMALEVLSFLVLDEYLLVVEFPVTIVAPNLRRSLLLLSHRRSPERSRLLSIRNRFYSTHLGSNGEQRRRE